MSIDDRLTKVVTHRGAWAQGDEVVVNPAACGSGNSCESGSCSTQDGILADLVTKTGGRMRAVNTDEGTFSVIGGRSARIIEENGGLGDGRW